MKNTKKILTLLLAGAMALTVMSGCSDKKNAEKNGEASNNTQVVAPDAKWNADYTNHWKLDKNNNKAEVGLHTLSELNICSVCGFEVYDYGDGSYETNEYNVYEHVVESVYYDYTGEVYKTKYEHKYDAEGHHLYEKAVSDEGFVFEYEYALDADGNEYIKSEKTDNDDGSHWECDYDNYGNPLREYLVLDDGTLGMDMTYEYKYDAEGQVIGLIAHDSGVLSQEYEYKYDKNGVSYEYRSIFYLDDGVKQISEYNDNQDIVSDGLYDENGEAMDLTVWEYDYDDQGNALTTREIYNGELVKLTVSEYDADGYIYDKTVTEYNDDGTATVTTYDEEWNVVSVVTAEANG